jgi:integrase
VNIALANEWLEKDPFIKFKGSIDPVEREFLSIEELQILEDKVLPILRLEEVRDIFVFACYTGLAYADIAKLTQSEIEIGIDGTKWIFTHREKTETKSNIPLLPKALEIIEKYKNHPECSISGKLLPIKSNQKTNAYLKEIATLCGITKILTFHSARHTFATTVTLTNGVPIESVSSMLGHKNIRTTQIYAKVVERKVSEDMMKLKSKLLKTQSKHGKKHSYQA